MAEGKATIDVQFTVNGEPYAAALVVGPDDVLVLNLGRSTTAMHAADARARLHEMRPDLDDRVLFVGAESMAVIRRDDAVRFDAAFPPRLDGGETGQ